MAREGADPGSAQRPAQPPSRPLGPTMLHQGGAPDAAGSADLASGVCHPLVRSLGASVPSPHLGWTSRAQKLGLLAGTPGRPQQELAFLRAWHSELPSPDG